MKILTAVWQGRTDIVGED